MLNFSKIFLCGRKYFIEEIILIRNDVLDNFVHVIILKTSDLFSKELFFFHPKRYWFRKKNNQKKCEPKLVKLFVLFTILTFANGNNK